jgi:folate-binding protein YgfZ
MPYPLLLHGKHRGDDVTYLPFGEWIVPWRFDSCEAEYQTLRTGVGLIDYSHHAVIEVSGADRVSFLHNLLTNDIQRLSPGAGVQAALLTDSAKLIAELLVLADENSLWLLCNATRAASLAQTLERYHISEQVCITNHERRDAVLALQGPRAIECLIQLLGRVVSLPQTGDHGMFVLQQMPIRIVRHSLLGGIGVLCICLAEQAQVLWEGMARRGIAYGLRMVGWEALNVARIEAGIPWFGVDMDDSNLLPETGLERIAVSGTKGCYVGQEVIARMETYGSPNKKLMGLLVEGDVAVEPGASITCNGEDAGRVTSACLSVTLKRSIAMGYVKRGAYEPGTAVEIRQGARPLAATVTTRPFVP